MGRDLAKQADVPKNYLSKILVSLNNAGMVEATRGTGGGYRLHRSPQQIRLIEVVELFEGSQKEIGCLLDSRMPCSPEQPCGAHQNWEKVTSAYLNFLDTTTLADIARVPHSSLERDERSSLQGL